MELNYLAIVLATVLQFIAGWVWYMPIFGKAWGAMHGFDQLSKEEQDKAQKEMGPQLGIQFVGTFIMTAVLALFVSELSAEWHAFGAAGFLWLGFVVPTQAAAVMFGGTPKQWMLKKGAIMASGSLVSLMIAAAVLSLFSN
jgi:hypothetical protein